MLYVYVCRLWKSSHPILTVFLYSLTISNPLYSRNPIPSYPSICRSSNILTSFLQLLLLYTYTATDWKDGHWKFNLWPCFDVHETQSMIIKHLNTSGSELNSLIYLQCNPSGKLIILQSFSCQVFSLYCISFLHKGVFKYTTCMKLIARQFNLLATNWSCATRPHNDESLKTLQ